MREAASMNQDTADQLLEGQSVIITGAAQGIGAGMARSFAAQGAALTLVDRQASVDSVGEGIGARVFVGDVADADFVRDVVAAVGSVHVLVNNAGEVWPTGPLDPWEQALQDYDRLIGSNLRGAFLFGRAVAPIMAANGGGNIINVSSDHIAPDPQTGWHHGHGAMDLYNASKWALNGLTFDWAKALRTQNIRVNNLCMGATDTEMLRAWIGKEPDPDYLATWMTPAGIAQVVLDLIAEGPTGRTGDNIGLWAGHPTVLPAATVGEAI